MKRSVTSLALVCAGVGLAVSFATGCASVKQEDPYLPSPIKFEERPAPYNEALDVWGGWTDGTAVYDYDTYRAIDPGYNPADPKYVQPWGMVGFPAAAVDVTDATAEDYDGELAALATKAGITWLVADIHAKGTGPTGVGGTFCYDSNGTGEDLGVFSEGGVTFFAKAGDDPQASKSLTVNFFSKDFSPWTDTVNAPPGVHCGYAGANQCFDGPHIAVQLREHWRQYILPFRVFRQNGYGLAIPDFFQTRGLQQMAGINFGLPANQTFDVWIAAVGFYKAKDYPPDLY